MCVAALHPTATHPAAARTAEPSQTVAAAASEPADTRRSTATQGAGKKQVGCDQTPERRAPARRSACVQPQTMALVGALQLESVDCTPAELESTRQICARSAADAEWCNNAMKQLSDGLSVEVICTQLPSRWSQGEKHTVRNALQNVAASGSGKASTAATPDRPPQQRVRSSPSKKLNSSAEALTSAPDPPQPPVQPPARAAAAPVVPELAWDMERSPSPNMLVFPPELDHQAPPLMPTQAPPLTAVTGTPRATAAAEVLPVVPAGAAASGHAALDSAAGAVGEHESIAQAIKKRVRSSRASLAGIAKVSRTTRE